MSNPKDRLFTLEQLAELLHLPLFTINEAWLDEELHQCEQTLLRQNYEDDIEETPEEVEKIEEQAQKAVDKEISLALSKYETIIVNNAEWLAKHYGLTIDKVDDYNWSFSPRSSVCITWATICNALIDTINGVGMFEFANAKDFKDATSCSTYKEAAQKHLHHMYSYLEVYGHSYPFNVEY